MASSPSMPGMRRSMSTTSGWVSSTRRRAVAPSAASPTSVKRPLPATSSIMRRPSRTTRWSSTTTIRMGVYSSPISRLLKQCFTRRTHGRDRMQTAFFRRVWAGETHHRSLSWGTLYLQVSSHQSSTLTQTQQPVVSSQRRNGCGIKTVAVITHFNRQCRVLLSGADPGTVGLRMASDIGQSFPDDAQHLLIERRRKQGQSLQFNATRDAGGGGKALHFFLHRRRKIAYTRLCSQIVDGTASSGQRGTSTVHRLS